MINGFACLIVYAGMSIPVARYADRGRYSLTIVLALSCWSLLTMLGAAAVNGVQFAISPMGVAIGESGATLPAHALLTHNLPAEERSRALAVFTLGVPLAAFIGNSVGGLFGHHLGWRMTFLIMGGSGLSLPSSQRRSCRSSPLSLRQGRACRTARASRPFCGAAACAPSWRAVRSWASALMPEARSYRLSSCGPTI